MNILSYNEKSESLHSQDVNKMFSFINGVNVKLVISAFK